MIPAAVIVALPFVLGLGLAEMTVCPLRWLLAVAVPLFFTAVVWERARPSLLPLLLVLTGWISLETEQSAIGADDLRRVVADRVECVTLQGRLADRPQRKLTTVPEPGSIVTLVSLQTERLFRGPKPTEVTGTVLVRTAGELPPYFVEGREVRVTGLLRQPATAAAPGVFDYRSFLDRQRIHYQLAVETSASWELADPTDAVKALPLSERFLRWARRTMARGLPGEDEALQLGWAMTLGEKTALTDEMAQPFMRTGTMHIFAISGLHVALITGILVSLLRLVQLPRSLCAGLVIPAIWFYTGVTGWQSSAVRSAIMMTIVVAGWSLHRPVDVLNSLAAAALLILMWDPQQLFQASFQLSFLVVLAMALLTRRLDLWLSQWIEPDPFLPESLVPPWQQRLRWGAGWIIAAGATTGAAWVGSLPLVAHYFAIVTPVSLLVNLAAVPISSLALMSHLGSLFCGDWLPWVTEWFNHGGWFWMELLKDLCRWTAQWPGAFFYVRAPSPLEVAMAYALPLGAGLATRHLSRRRAWGLWSAVATLMGAWLWAREPAARLTVIPLDGGEALVCDLAGRHRDLLVDGGRASEAHWTTVPFLRAQGVDRLENLLLTHGDVQHVGGAAELMAELRPRHVALGPLPFRSKAFREALAFLPAGSKQVVKVGDTFAGWQVLHPGSGDRFRRADDAAIVLTASISGWRVVLASDLGTNGWARLASRCEDLTAEVLVTGLPREQWRGCGDLLDRLKPRLVIDTSGIAGPSVSEAPRVGQSDGSGRWDWIDTGRCGAVTLDFTPDYVTVTPQRGEARRVARPLQAASTSSG